jgi:hypothetical protein
VCVVESTVCSLIVFNSFLLARECSNIQEPRTASTGHEMKVHIKNFAQT